jgi:predicted nucleic acid-binding protein
LVLLGEVTDYWPILRAQLSEGRVSGSRVHDAHIAALCAQHGVSELWSADRDFSRFPGLPTRNPLLAAD